MPRNKGWFRVYDRMIDSPDILELNDAEFRVIVSLWCLASQGGSEEGYIGYRNGALWRRVAPQMKRESFEAILTRLKDIGLLLGDDGDYRVKDWSRHQYQFDSYKPSVRRLKKEAKSNECESIVNTSSNDCKANIKTDTDTETDTDTDTETNIFARDSENSGIDENSKNVKNLKIQKQKTKKEIPKRVYGEFENVRLTDPELEKLRERFPNDYLDWIETLSRWKASNGKKKVNDYATILAWERREQREKANRPPEQSLRETKTWTIL